MKIGFSTRLGPRTYWNLWFKERGHSVLEIDLKKSYISYEPERLKRITSDIKNFDLSLHSATTCLFLNEPNIIDEAQQKTLLAEIKIASLLDAHELIFHMPIDVNLNKIEPECERFFKEAVKFANLNGIKLILENNSKGTFASESDLKWFLDNVANIGLCVDIGHLNRAVKRGLANLDAFASMLGDNIMHAHIHNNNGEADEHNSLSKGTFPYEQFLPKLKNIRKYIIETSDYEDGLETYQILNKIIGNSKN